MLSSFAAPHSLQNMIWRASAFTHTGHIRQENQDAYLCQPQLGVWLVADGMGGHSQGAYASRKIVESLRELGTTVELAEKVSFAKSRLAEVNQHLFERAQSLGESIRIGSTVVAVIAAKDRCACLWAGDSRVYLLRKGQLFQVTRDHSLESEWADAGVSQDEIARHPRRHVLTRAVGGSRELNLEVKTFTLQLNDVLMLCSDGVYRELSHEELAILMGLQEPSLITHALQTHILRRRAGDNFSAVAIRVERGVV